MWIISESTTYFDPWEDILEEACQSHLEDEVGEKSDLSERKAKDVFGDMKSTYRKALMNTFCTKPMWFGAMNRDSIYKAIK